MSRRRRLLPAYIQKTLETNPVLGLPQLNIDQRLRWLILSSSLPELLSRCRVYTQCETIPQSVLKREFKHFTLFSKQLSGLVLALDWIASAHCIQRFAQLQMMSFREGEEG